MWSLLIWLVLGVLVVLPQSMTATTSLEVLPREDKQWTDPETGTRVTFLTSDPAHDQNLYYEQRSWLADSSLIVFNSQRTNGGLMGYLTATGELVRITSDKGGFSGATCAKSRNSLYACRGAEIVEITLDIQPSRQPECIPSKVSATERVICTLSDVRMPPNTSLSENSDGTLLSLGVGGRNINSLTNDGQVLAIRIDTGEIKEVARMPGSFFGGHVMFSLTNPNLVSFCERYHWITVRDVRNGQAVFNHHREQGEFCTHHCWWVNDSITFCGGFHPGPTEDADVKAIDIHTGITRIIGRGNWWPEAVPAQLARCNWWHSCGYEGGQWVAADNWYGDIAVFDARTTRTTILTKGHRTYGGGTHPEVGWDRKGKEVIFASHRQGNVDVAVAEVPDPLPPPGEQP